MYCPNCGAEVKGIFCHECGTKIVETKITESKDELLKKCRIILGFVYAIAEKRNEILLLESQILESQEEAERRRKEVKIEFGGVGCWFTILGIAAFSLIPLWLIGQIMQSANTDHNTSSTWIAVFWVFFMVVIAILFFKWLNNLNKSKVEQGDQYDEENTVPLIKQLNEKRMELKEYILENERSVDLDLIPPKYMSVDAIAFFIMVMEDKRADTLKEAINLYEMEKKHQEIMAMHQNEIDVLNESIRLSADILNIQGKTLQKVYDISDQMRFENISEILAKVKGGEYENG